MSRLSMSAYDSALSDVNCSERKKPPNSSSPSISAIGVVAENAPYRTIVDDATSALIRQHRAESEALEDARRQRLHEHRRGRRRAGQHAGLQRREAEAELQHQRQQERRRADADAEQRTADDAREVGPHTQEAEVQHGPPALALETTSVHDVAGDARRAGGDAHARSERRQQVLAERRRAERQRRQPDPRQQEALPVERRAQVLDDLRHEAAGQRPADQPDRHVDEEDPAPVPVGADEAAERRPEDRAEQRRHRQVRQHLHELDSSRRSSTARGGRPAPSSRRPCPARSARRRSRRANSRSRTRASRTRTPRSPSGRRCASRSGRPSTR